jgi:hypothetical protein
MSRQRAASRSLQEWMSLITECRQSGLSDAAWCEQNGISVSCFYNAVSRLRKKACEIPDPVNKPAVLDLTASRQDVARIAIEPEVSPAEVVPAKEPASMHLDNSHTIEIEMNGILIKMSNSINPLLLEKVLKTLGTALC